MGPFFYEIFCLLPFMVCLVWSVILGLELKDGRRPVQVLWYFAIACTLLYFCHSLHFSRIVPAEPRWSQCLYLACNLAVYPLFYLYIRSLTNAGVQKRLLPRLLAPAAIVAISSCITLIHHQPDGPAGTDELELVHGITVVIFAIEVALTGIFGIRDLTRYRHKVANFYADTEERSLPDLLTLLILFIITAVISTVANLVGRDFFNGKLLLAFPSCLFSALLFCIFIWGYRCRCSAEDMIDDLRTDTVPETAAQSGKMPQQEQLYASICKAMEEEKLFLKPDLKITDLLLTVGSNRTYVSNCINRQSGCSFSEFVHGYRIRYALTLMEKGGLSLQETASQSGYLDGNAFYKAFTRIMGKSPSAWLKEHGKTA